MPISKTSLSKRINDNIVAAMGAPPPSEKASDLKKMTDAIAEAVVDEIQENLTAVPTGLTSPTGPVGGTINARDFK